MFCGSSPVLLRTGEKKCLFHQDRAPFSRINKKKESMICQKNIMFCINFNFFNHNLDLNPHF